MNNADEWSPLNRFLFRFAFIYLFFFIFPFPITYIPILNYGATYYSYLINVMVVLFSVHVMKVPLTFLNENGSGDPTFRYMEFFVYFIIACIGAILWSLIDNKHKHYEKLYKWLRFFGRIYLASVLISYGTCKVIPSQFITPGLTRLVQSFGDASPMGLLWTFMGASMPYTIFTGFMELIPGLLLLFARTTTIGALLSCAVFIHVFMLNMSYDVPVKLFSLHYLLLSIFLLIPDIKSLLQFFFLKKQAQIYSQPPLFEKRSLAKTIVCIQISLALYLVGGGLYQSYLFSKKLKTDENKIKYYGIWMVKSFRIDGILSENLDPEEKWRYLIFEYPENACIIAEDGTKSWIYKRELKEDDSVQLWTGNEEAEKQNYLVKIADDDELRVFGKWRGKDLSATLRKIDHKDFLLVKRGFHWINEYPYNK